MNLAEVWFAIIDPSERERNDHVDNPGEFPAAGT